MKLNIALNRFELTMTMRRNEPRAMTNAGDDDDVDDDDDDEDGGDERRGIEYPRTMTYNIEANVDDGGNYNNDDDDGDDHNVGNNNDNDDNEDDDNNNRINDEGDNDVTREVDDPRNDY